MSSRQTPDVAQYVKASTKASGVPERVTDKSVLMKLARLLRKP